MRGKHPLLAACHDWVRNIPAHAGKTSLASRMPRLGEEHPRACGENALVGLVCRRHVGTSPRMRGKHPAQHLTTATARNIPAHAGKTHHHTPTPPTPKEHPRACGENALVGLVCRRHVGTSPRMRGKHPAQHLTTATARNIPAHAGKTASYPAGHTAHPEHPRACGENLLLRTASARGSGTSPRMRGKRVAYISMSWGSGNIPAHAGKTLTAGGSEKIFWEHPRACGENMVLPSKRSRSFGTSPRMRGKQKCLLMSIKRGRNIPAHAGKTQDSVRISLASEEHPRACGENHQ